MGGKVKRYKPIVGMTLSKDLLKALDQDRGVIPRSNYVEKVLREYLEGKGYKIKGRRRLK